MSSVLLEQARHPAAEQKHVLLALQNKQANKQEVQMQLAISICPQNSPGPVEMIRCAIYCLQAQPHMANQAASKLVLYMSV